MELPFHDPQLRFRSAPRLETERLVLRGVEVRDHDYFQSFFADEEATRFVGGPSNREDTWRRMLTGAAFWPVTGIGMWAIEEKASGKAVGHVGVFDFQRDIDPPVETKVEMGWILAPAVHGKGYALEACLAMLEWFDANFSGQPMFALISVGNEPSMRLAEKLGFVRQADGVYRDHAQTIWLRTA